MYTPQADPPQVVLIFIDTLRADAMGMYGYGRDTSPKLDAGRGSRRLYPGAVRCTVDASICSHDGDRYAP